MVNGLSPTTFTNNSLSKDCSHPHDHAEQIIIIFFLFFKLFMLPQIKCHCSDSSWNFNNYVLETFLNSAVHYPLAYAPQWICQTLPIVGM